MTFAFGDDGIISVHETEADVQREWEPPDVESGAVVFYDERGTWLKPEFITPNKRSLFGGITFGQYRLVASAEMPPDVDPIELALSEAVGVEPNPRFASVAAIRRHIQSQGPDRA